MKEIHYYICKVCERVDVKPCILMIKLSPGLPSECPFDLGFTSDWKEASKEEYQKVVNAF